MEGRFVVAAESAWTVSCRPEFSALFLIRLERSVRTRGLSVSSKGPRVA